MQRDRIVAVFTGTFSSVILAQLDIIHERQIPLISPLGSVTTITRNGRVPNYAFRTAMSDDYANEFMVRYAVDVVGVRHPGIIADTTAWGDSNVDGLSHWVDRWHARRRALSAFPRGDEYASPVDTTACNRRRCSDPCSQCLRGGGHHPWDGHTRLEGASGQP